MITANAQNLGISFLEPAVNAPEGDGLLRSSACKVENVEGEDDVFRSSVLAQGNVPVVR
jgi:hypothetical protein